MPEETRDPRTLRALAHPLRWKLIDVLTGEGTATATRCAELLGESVASCSYHLNFLAKYGFVAQGTGGRGREKPWRLTSLEQDLSSGRASDLEGWLAARAAGQAFLDHEVDRLKDAVRRADEEPPQWREATVVAGVTVRLTAEELREVTEALREIQLRYADRVGDATAVPPGAREARIFIATSLAPPVG